MNTTSEQHIYNSSNNNSDDVNYQAPWYTVQVITIVNFVCEFYFFLSLLTYGLRSGKLRSLKHEPTRKSSILMLLAITSPVTHMVSLTFQQLQLAQAVASEELWFTCDVIMDLRLVTIFMATLHTYAYLWYRQKLFYNQPSIKHLKTPLYSVISFSSIILLVAGLLGLVVANNWSHSYVMTSHGCVTPLYELRKLGLYYMYFTCFLVIMTTIFGLFVYPLLRHRRSRHHNPVSSANDVDIVYRAIRKSAVSLAICFLSAIAAMIAVANLFPKYWPRYPTTAMYDASLVVDTLAVIFCYDDHKSILCGWWRVVSSNSGGGGGGNRGSSRGNGILVTAAKPHTYV